MGTIASSASKAPPAARTACGQEPFSGRPAPSETEMIRAALLAWYDAEARSFPWRTPPNPRQSAERPDPYRIWLSEIMLQQTTTQHAAPYFERFLRRWPRVEDLAAAADEEVMAAWAGLGYYARARNLLACARKVAREGRGRFPETLEELRALPGVGPYTAAAVAAIAFGAPANVVDGNIERVASRLFAIAEPLPAGKAAIHAAAGELVTEDRPGDWAQALMDLGAEVCTPRAPKCPICPLAFTCRARADGRPEAFPARAPRPLRPVRVGGVFVFLEEAASGSRVGLVRRPAKGLLGGMLGLPTTDWRAGGKEPPAHEPPEGAGALSPVGRVRHRFTHFDLELDVFCGVEGPDGLVWTSVDGALRDLPTVFRKALLLAAPQGTGHGHGRRRGG